MLEHVPRSIGRALRGVRAGMGSIFYFDTALSQVAETIVVSSAAFADGEGIPREFTADGIGHSPPLQWSGVPAEALGLVVVIEDPDAPSPKPLVHAIAWSLPPHDGAIEGGELGGGDTPEGGIALGRNSFLRAQYLPPDPPKGHGKHRYAFQVFAIGRSLHFDAAPGRSALFDAMRPHMLARGVLIGTYERT